MKENYDVLLNKYNVAIARVRELEDHNKQNTTMWQEYAATMTVLEKNARDLCEKILAKDPHEMVLGNAKTWDRFSTRELIQKASKSFDIYVKEKTELLKTLLATAEERQATIESLTDQFSQMYNASAERNGTPPSVEEIKKNYDDKKKKDEVVDNLDAKTKNAVINKDVQLIINDAEDITADELELYEEAMMSAESARLTPNSKPTTKTEAFAKEMKNMKENTHQAFMVDLNRIAKHLGESEWSLIRVMGEEGTSRRPLIISKAMEQATVSESKMRSAMFTLQQSSVIATNKFNLPLSSNTLFDELTDIGSGLYELKYGEKPVKSEMAKVRSEHDNCEHGYGILDIQNALVETKKYKSVNGFNRNKPINVVIDGQKKQYIPDIVCKDKDANVTYIEYEKGTHTQADFNEKCNKMCRVTKHLIFVVPNQKIAMSIKNKIDGWVKIRKVQSLKGYTVAIYTARNIKYSERASIEYVFSQSENPIRMS